MSAEQLIALEAALGELGTLYIAAKRFTALRSAADADLLPSTARLGAMLRTLLRRGQFDDAAVAIAARDIARLRTHWEAELAAVRDSPAYRQALAAWEAGDAAILRRALPNILADIAPITPPPALFVGVSAASGRRRPGARPFLTAEECAEKIAGYRDHGIPCEAGGTHWWDRELATVPAADDPEALDTPIALRLDTDRLGLPVFRLRGGALYHLCCQTLRVPFSVALQADVEDEWWQAYEESYGAYRDQLRQHLQRLGFEGIW